MNPRSAGHLERYAARYQRALFASGQADILRG